MVPDTWAINGLLDNVSCGYTIFDHCHKNFHIVVTVIQHLYNRAHRQFNNCQTVSSKAYSINAASYYLYFDKTTVCLLFVLTSAILITL